MQAFFECPAHESSMRAIGSEVAIPSIKVGIEVNHGNWTMHFY